MSERIGPVSFSDDDHDVFLGRDFVQRKDYSERKAQEIDEEVHAILTSMYDSAKALLAENRATLDRISEALLERETLDTEELRLLVQNQSLPPLPTPVTAAKKESAPKRAGAEPSGKKFPGDKLPDPEPVPG
jgi:cell division protease FtsH